MENKKSIVTKYADGNLVVQILVGIVLGVVVAMISKELAMSLSIFGTLFVGAFKSYLHLFGFVSCCNCYCYKRSWCWYRAWSL